MSVTLTDPRGQRSRAALHAAVLRLLQTRPLADVTVSALCREAGLHRTTFYKHYASLEAAAASALSGLCAELVADQELASAATHALEGIARAQGRYRLLATPELAAQVRAAFAESLGPDLDRATAQLLAGALAGLVASRLAGADVDASALAVWEAAARAAEVACGR